MNKWSKVKTLEDKPMSGWLVFFSVFFFLSLRNVIVKAVSICVIILQDRKVKEFNLQYQSFEHNSMKIYDQKRLESLEVKKAAHMRTWL